MNEILRINNSNDSDINANLLYVVKLIGVPPEKLMIEDLSIIIDYLKRNLESYPVSDIRLAFEVGLKGLLDIKDLNHYHSFNALYVTNILQSYKRYKQKENAKPKLVAPIEKQLPMSKETKEDQQKKHFDIIDNWVKEKGEVPLIANWSEAFLHMNRIGLIKMTKEEGTMFVENIRYELEEEKKRLKLEGSNYGHISNMLSSKILLSKEARKRYIIKYYENKKNKKKI